LIIRNPIYEIGYITTKEENMKNEKLTDKITGLTDRIKQQRLKELKHEKNLGEGEFEFEVKIRNVIYETRTVHADSEEEAEEKVQEDLDNFNPHVEEDECDGAEIEEVTQV